MFLAPVPEVAVTPEAVEAAAKVLMRGGSVQDMLEAAAPSIAAAALGDGGPGGEGTARIRAAERARCAAVLANVPPLDFLAAHGLEPGAAAGRVLIAAAAHILAPGGNGPGRPLDGPSTAGAVPGGSGTAPDGSEPAETATAP
jgi:hypothetical protein